MYEVIRKHEKSKLRRSKAEWKKERKHGKKKGRVDESEKKKRKRKV